MNRTLLNYLGIAVGAAITALGLNMFLIPNKIAAGGVSGLATVLHHLLGVPVGLTMIAFDVPLLLISLKVLGPRFGVNTLLGAVILALSIDVSAPYIPALTHDLLLSALYGGVISGLGLGIVFRSQGTTAGTDQIAAIINKLFSIPIGQALMMVDFFVIATAGIVFKSAELSLYALISLFVTSKIIDLIQEGPSSAKVFLIVTTIPETIADAILADLSRGVTLFSARGGYTKQAGEMVMCVVSTREVTQLKELVSQLDEKAFVIVADAHEVLGEGFSK
ncbi:YitT family protein [Propionispora hippei]|uniref:Uncharacterized membrane-anchored protein YitT, contains DUF161 and DUF2179 domains n=1 Tax=Propionispora hippei DSM 15287 TaxID=1123003 RepID=A0A1M6FJL1_9FIRM|nr:YitT family protein [Propionispora hippei]SHI97920.1 Uncharacterized membrane-anchored protein YitT, contains DUF161 and DUF2179 domains [Propionispora hippei DSM 15287]